MSYLTMLPMTWDKIVKKKVCAMAMAMVLYVVIPILMSLPDTRHES